MYVNPFLAGCLTVIGIEVVIVLAALIITIIKHTKNGGNKNV
jgi:hypothetical protein